MVLPQNLFWSGKGHLGLLWKGKLEIDGAGLPMGSEQLAHLIILHTPAPVRLSVEELA
jgi:hypothetical protein